MFEKLRALEDKFNEINERLMQPEVVNDSKLYTELMIEYKNLEPVVEALREYDKQRLNSMKQWKCPQTAALTLI